MIVYRIEDAFGRGPYRDHSLRDFSANQIEDLAEMVEYHRDSQHPHPSEDGIDSESVFLPSTSVLDGRQFNPAYYCGFDSIESLCEWFSSFEPALAAAGFSVYEYEIDETVEGSVLFGHKQVVFKKEFARLDAINDLIDLLVCTICDNTWCMLHGGEGSPYGIYPIRENA